MDPENEGFARPFPGFEGGMEWLREGCRSIPFKTITVKYFVKNVHRLTKNPYPSAYLSGDLKLLVGFAADETG